MECEVNTLTMNKEYLDKLIIEFLSNEYQSIWFCDVESKKISLYSINSSIIIPDAMEVIGKEAMYEDARDWYISKYVMEDQREEIEIETEFDNIVAKLTTNDRFIINFRRVLNDNINYNQLFFAKINKEQDELKYFIFGFRDYDYKRIAEKDELTGIYNRTGFFWHAENMMKKNPDKEYDLILSDFVNFKNFNETYGAKAGDQLLAQAGRYIQNIIGEDSLAGRYGGDQFVVLLNHEKYEEFVNDTLFDDSPEARRNLPNVEVKFGVCLNVDLEKSMMIYCDRAHVAVNTIKHKYGERVAVFNDDIQDMIEKQRKIEADMQAALDEGQFKVYYQPKHDTVSGKIVGGEALVRWIHPQYGFMSPADFIPVFERNGFIVKLDSYVFERTCENLRRWMDEGKPIVPISVNASKLTVENQGMVYLVNKAMRKNNVPGNLIHIEITESLMSDDPETLIRRLEPLKGRGLQVELDDFGAGYASINMLSTLPLDVIKLDMSFMKQFGDLKRAKVLEGCVNLAKSLGYKTVSEGVETEEQLDALRKLGVDIIQGYYFSKPLPENEFEEYLKLHV